MKRIVTSARRRVTSVRRSTVKASFIVRRLKFCRG
jgi:hypothetical protein